MPTVPLSPEQIADFRGTVWEYYRHAGRHGLPWRQPVASGTFDPYHILVSELMLQQTQVNRVIPKFTHFLELFPSIQALSDSSLAAVLTVWSGLGYNRRAKFLQQAANMVHEELDGTLPSDLISLQKLPGVGANTAGAILAYAFNQPVVFVETNIRTVYFHHFWEGQAREAVSDQEVTRLIEATLDTATPREWYWALMDYGAYLKATGIKLNTLSKHYTKQSTFQGSLRQVRGQVIRVLAQGDKELVQLTDMIDDDRLARVLTDLLAEGLIMQTAARYHLSDERGAKPVVQ